MEAGMRTLRTDGWNKVKGGETTIEEVLRVTQIEEHLESLAGGEQRNSSRNDDSIRFTIRRQPPIVNRKSNSMARWHSCNILHTAPDANRLWQFDAKSGGFALNREHSGAAGEPLPSDTGRQILDVACGSRN